MILHFGIIENKSLAAKLGLKDFSTAKDDMNLRFWNHGQVVEITKRNDSIFGELTNYIYHLEQRTEKRRDTIYQKSAIDSETSRAILDLFQSSGIWELQSDNMIGDWSQGADGITYIIEHSDNDTYWFKHYWTPSAQDSIPESLMVLDFINKISDTLNLNKNYKNFRDNLPHRGCYNSGGMVIMCYISKLYSVGYYGSTKLPLGYSASVQL